MERSPGNFVKGSMMQEHRLQARETIPISVRESVRDLNAGRFNRYF
jgi:hypothetical protein